MVLHPSQTEALNVAEARVRVFDDRVEKRVGKGAERTAAKYRLLHDISAASGFVAPDVLATDRRAGTVVLERIDDITSVRDVYWALMRGKVDPHVAAGLWRRIGAVLAMIHRHRPADRGETWVAPASFRRKLAAYGSVATAGAPVPMATVHGDFGFANVFVRGSAPWQIVVIDPCHDGYSTTADWTYGPTYLDLGKMLLSLEGKVPLAWQAFLDRASICLLQEAFLEGYAEVSGTAPDTRECCAYAYGLADLYCAARYPVLSQLALGILFNRSWKRNYPWSIKKQQLDRMT